MDLSPTTVKTIQEAVLPLDRDRFLRIIIGEMAETLQDIVGEDEARGFMAVIGQRVGEHINGCFKAALQVESFTREQVAAICVEFKRRIEGGFFIISQDDNRIVFGNHKCPFGTDVVGRPTVCMMTSNVFGTIAAQSLGYGKVSIDKSIAKGDGECLVTLHLRRIPESDAAPGREYYKKVEDEPSGSVQPPR